jgi:hypothetical protein
MRRVIILIVTLALTTFAMELFLRKSRIASPILKYYNETFGSLNRSNIDYYKTKEGLYIGNTNYDGRFGENYPKRKEKKSTLRIGLIGDSFVEGIDVFSRNHFSKVIEQRLSKHYSTDVQVLNFGRGNCTLHASSYYFENYIKEEYDLDIILYFAEGRDIFEVNEYPSTTYTLNDEDSLVPSYEWSEATQFKMHKKISEFDITHGYDQLSLFSLFFRAMSGVRMRGFNKLTFGKFAGEIETQDYNFSELPDVQISNLSAKIIQKLYPYNLGKMFFVVRGFPIDASALKSYFDSQNIEYFDLIDTFDGYNIRNTDINAYYFEASQSYGGHWNHRGHRAVGHYLSDRIIQKVEISELPNFTLND